MITQSDHSATITTTLQPNTPQQPGPYKTHPGSLHRITRTRNLVRRYLPTTPTIMAQETLQPAFPTRPRPLLSHGLPFPSAAAKHVQETFSASRIYIIISGSLARNTDALDRLSVALGPEKIVGVRRGMKSHTMWSDVLEIIHEVRQSETDLILTLGGGSLTDGAKVVAFVCYPLLPFPFFSVHPSTIEVYLGIYANSIQRQLQMQSKHQSASPPSPKAHTNAPKKPSTLPKSPSSPSQPLSPQANTPISLVQPTTPHAENTASRPHSADPNSSSSIRN